jgi:hypothetical protein
VETSKSSLPSSGSLLLVSGNETANLKPLSCVLFSSAICGTSNETRRIAKNETRRALVLDFMDSLPIPVVTCAALRMLPQKDGSRLFDLQVGKGGLQGEPPFPTCKLAQIELSIQG